MNKLTAADLVEEWFDARLVGDADTEKAAQEELLTDHGILIARVESVEWVKEGVTSNSNDTQ